MESRRRAEHLDVGRLNRHDFLHSRNGCERRRVQLRRAVAIIAATLSVFLILVLIAFFHNDLQMRSAAVDPISPIPHRVTKIYRTQAARVQAHRKLKKAVRLVTPFRATPRPPRVLTVASRRRAEYARLLAVAVGGQPQAIVAAGAQTRIVTIGDVVDGHRIAAIVLDGLRFAGVQQMMRIRR